eukprot:m.400462 g.400462  ORF g.400462 m.400462 type:complete len:500 (+) comp20114_c10_seq2:849-2348(+)
MGQAESKVEGGDAAGAEDKPAHDVAEINGTDADIDHEQVTGPQPRIVTIVRESETVALGMNIETTVEGMSTVSQIVPGSLAAKAGLHPHDKIIAINEDPVPGLQHDAVVDLLRSHKTLNLLVCPSEGGAPSAVTFPSELTTTVELVRERGKFGFKLAEYDFKDGSYVINTVSNSPIGRAGNVAIGHRLIAIDEFDVSMEPHDVVVQMLRHREQAALTFVFFPGDKIANLVRAPGEKWGIDVEEDLEYQGSLISRVKEGSPAARCGVLRPGDRVIGVNHRKTVYHSDVLDAFKEADANQLWVHLCSPSSGHRKGHGLNGSGKGKGEANGPPAELPDGPLEAGVRRLVVERGASGLGFRVGTHKTRGLALAARVVDLAPDGPAAKAGLRINDYLKRINGHEVNDQSHAEIVAWLNALPAVRLDVMTIETGDFGVGSSNGGGSGEQLLHVAMTAEAEEHGSPSPQAASTPQRSRRLTASAMASAAASPNKSRMSKSSWSVVL